jgi:hypothetical protein
LEATKKADACCAASQACAPQQPVFQAPQRRGSVMTDAVAQKWLLPNTKVPGAKARYVRCVRKGLGLSGGRRAVPGVGRGKGRSTSSWPAQLHVPLSCALINPRNLPPPPQKNTYPFDRMLCLGWAGSNSGAFKGWSIKEVEIVKVELPARNA